MKRLDEGQRVYNGGDMANASHFGTITGIMDDKWGLQYQVTPDADSDRTAPYWVSSAVFSEEYKGHGGTRFVTKEAYDAFRAVQIARMIEWRERSARVSS